MLEPVLLKPKCRMIINFDIVEKFLRQIRDDPYSILWHEERSEGVVIRSGEVSLVELAAVRCKQTGAFNANAC